MAVAHIDGTLFTVVMKSALLHGLWLQSVMLRKTPEKVHCTSTLIVAGCCCIYVLSCMEGSMGGAVIGILTALAAALTDALSDFSFDLGSQVCKARARATDEGYIEDSGEGERCLITFLFGAAVASF